MKKFFPIIDSELRLLHPEARKIENFKNFDKPIRKDVFDHSKAKNTIKLFNIESIKKSMEKCKIDFGIISGLAWTDQNMQKENNEYVKSCILKNSKRFRGLYIPDVSSPDKAADEIMNLNKKIYVGVELIPKWQAININQENLEPIFNAVMKRNLFLKVYTAHPTQTLDGDAPYRTLQFLKKYPKIRTLIPHMGGMLCVYGLFPPIRKIIKNAFFITSVSATMKMVKFAAEVNPNNILFGTDYPGNHCFNQMTPLNQIKKMDISNNAKKNILGKKAFMMFGFSSKIKLKNNFE